MDFILSRKHLPHSSVLIRSTRLDSAEAVSAAWSRSLASSLILSRMVTPPHCSGPAPRRRLDSALPYRLRPVWLLPASLIEVWILSQPKGLASSMAKDWTPPQPARAGPIPFHRSAPLRTLLQPVAPTLSTLHPASSTQAQPSTRQDPVPEQGPTPSNDWTHPNPARTRPESRPRPYGPALGTRTPPPLQAPTHPSARLISSTQRHRPTPPPPAPRLRSPALPAWCAQPHHELFCSQPALRARRGLRPRVARSPRGL